MRNRQNYIAADSVQNSIYGRLINSPTFYLVCLNTEGYYTFVNPLFAQKFSHLADDFTELHHDETICPEDIDKTHEVIEQCLANPEQIYTLQVRKPDSEGGVAWSFWEVSALQDKDGDPCKIVCIGYDITEGEQASRQANAYAGKIDSIIENITDGFLIVDNSWNFLRVNCVTERLINLPRSQLIGRSLWEFIPDTAPFKFPQYFREAVCKGITTTFEEYLPVLSKWFEVTAYPSEEGLTIIFKDITERKHAEEKIKDFNNKLIAILDSTSDINILVSPDFKILSYNKVAEQSTRTLYNRQIKAGESIWEYILPGTEDDFQRYFESALNGVPVEIKIKLFFKPELSLWFKVRYFPVRDTENQLIGVAFNSTNIDKQQRQFERLEEIASLYSHEIRRPVATILGITQLINEKELGFENREWFEYMKKTTHELDLVIHKIVQKTSEIS